MEKKKSDLPATLEDLAPSSREKYFQFVKHTIDDYSGITYTLEEQQQIQRHLQKISTGAYTLIPLICTGDLCPFRLRCPYYQIGKAPVGKACIIEVQLLQHWTIQYMEEYQVDPENFTEVGYCNELAEIELLLYRINLSLSKPENAELVTDQTVGIGNDGTPIIQKQLSPFMEQKEKLQNRRSRIIKLMVGDRQEKYKKEAALKVRTEKDPSSKMAEMRRQIEGLQRSLSTIDQEPPKTSESIKDLQKILTPDALINSDE